jgi:Kef-type K+ transport system membrane component KefB
MITQISEIGVLLLMFMAGVETDIKALDQNRNSSIAVAVGGIAAPLFFLLLDWFSNWHGSATLSVLYGSNPE